MAPARSFVFALVGVALGCGEFGSGAESDGSGETGAAFDCAGAITEQACHKMSANAPQDASCTWARTLRYSSPDSCGQPAGSGGLCLEVAFQGAGCGVSETCWESYDWAPQTFYKLDDEGGAVVLTADVCSYWPTDTSWVHCEFGIDETTMEPVVTAPVCACVCG